MKNKSDVGISLVALSLLIIMFSFSSVFASKESRSKVLEMSSKNSVFLHDNINEPKPTLCPTPQPESPVGSIEWMKSLTGGECLWMCEDDGCTGDDPCPARTEDCDPEWCNGEKRTYKGGGKCVSGTPKADDCPSTETCYDFKGCTCSGTDCVEGGNNETHPGKCDDE